RVVAGAAGRHRPNVTVFAVDRHSHLLRGLVDRNQDICVRRLSEGERGECRGERECKSEETHNKYSCSTRQFIQHGQTRRRERLTRCSWKRVGVQRYLRTQGTNLA